MDPGVLLTALPNKEWEATIRVVEEAGVIEPITSLAGSPQQLEELMGPTILLADPPQQEQPEESAKQVRILDSDNSQSAQRISSLLTLEMRGPLRQPARRVLFAARCEISKQMATTLNNGVIQPSMGQPGGAGKDGSLSFCIDLPAPQWNHQP